MTTLRKLPISRENRKTTATKSSGEEANSACIFDYESPGGARRSEKFFVPRWGGLLQRPEESAVGARPTGDPLHPQITEPILKIGRYMATTRPPTRTPRIAMIIGSSKLLRLSTALSTSS